MAAKTAFEVELNLTKLKEFQYLLREFTDKSGTVNKTISLRIVKKDEPDQFGYDAFIAVKTKQDDPNGAKNIVGNARSKAQADRYWSEKRQRDDNDERYR